MKIGDKVQQRVTPIRGEIVDTIYAKDTHTLSHLVEWTEDDGEHVVSRWFSEAELEAQPEQDA